MDPQQLNGIDVEKDVGSTRIIGRGSGGRRTKFTKILLSAVVCAAVLVAVAVLWLSAPGFSNTTTDKSLNVGSPTSVGVLSNWTVHTSSASSSSSNSGAKILENSTTTNSSNTVNKNCSSSALFSLDFKTNARLLGRRYIDANAVFCQGVFENAMDRRRSLVRSATPRSSSLANAHSSHGIHTAANTQRRQETELLLVQEGDFVQRHGDRVFVVYGFELIVLLHDGETMSVVTRTAIPSMDSPDDTADSGRSCSDTVADMLLVGEDSLLVFSTRTCYPGEDDSVNSLFQYNTTVFFYNTKDMTQRGSETLPGVYDSSIAVGTNVHVVTSSYIEMADLTQYLDVSYIQSLSNATIDEASYRDKALKMLETQLDSYVEKVINSLDCTGYHKLDFWNVKGNGTDLDSVSFMSAFVSISTFAVSSVPLAKKTTSVMLPKRDWIMHATDDFMILAVESAYYNSLTFVETAPIPQTYLVAFALQDASATALTIGTVSGTVQSSFSMDLIQKNDVDFIRVATTSHPPQVWDENGGCIPNDREMESQVTVLQIVDGTAVTMPVVGQLERLTGDIISFARFNGDRAIVMSNNETAGVFHTIDVSDSANPIAVAHIEVAGFCSYIHEISKTLFLGIGHQSNDVEEQPPSLQLSLFDASDFTQPRLVQQWQGVNFNNETFSSSLSSVAMYDIKAFRYLEETNTLILPTRLRSVVLTDSSEDASSDSYDGFLVFHIDPVLGMQEKFAIKHATGDYLTDGCYGIHHLRPRSLVFTNNSTNRTIAITIKGHSIQSHDLLTTFETVGSVNLDEDVTDCVSDYYCD